MLAALIGQRLRVHPHVEHDCTEVVTTPWKQSFIFQTCLTAINIAVTLREVNLQPLLLVKGRQLTLISKWKKFCVQSKTDTCPGKWSAQSSSAEMIVRGVSHFFAKGIGTKNSVLGTQHFEITVVELAQMWPAASNSSSYFFVFTLTKMFAERAHHY